MKTLLFCLSLILPLKVDAALDGDLGVISPRRGVSLVHSRPDLSHFRLELLPETPPTNSVTLTITNGFLQSANLAGLPDGPGIVGVTAVFNDGEESEMAIYRYDLRRGRPAKPSATPVTILGEGLTPNGLTNEIRAIRSMAPVAPPPPLPKAAYDQQTRFYQSREGKRRNE